MPAVKDYVRGLAIPKARQEFDGWKVLKSKTEERVVERYRRYHFTTYVEMESEDARTSCGDAVSSRVKRKATVLSPYGNPYICNTSIQGCKGSANRARIRIEGDCRRTGLARKR